MINSELIQYELSIFWAIIEHMAFTLLYMTCCLLIWNQHGASCA